MRLVFEIEQLLPRTNRPGNPKLFEPFEYGKMQAKTKALFNLYFDKEILTVAEINQLLSEAKVEMRLNVMEPIIRHNIVVLSTMIYWRDVDRNRYCGVKCGEKGYNIPSKLYSATTCDRLYDKVHDLTQYIIREKE